MWGGGGLGRSQGGGGGWRIHLFPSLLHWKLTYLYTWNILYNKGVSKISTWGMSEGGWVVGLAGWRLDLYPSVHWWKLPYMTIYIYISNTCTGVSMNKDVACTR